MPNVLLFTNTIAPYRLPVFQQLSQMVDLKVLFAQGRTTDRRWDAQLTSYSFPHTILPHRTVRLGNAAQVINPSLLAHLWHSDFDVAVLGDNRQTALSGLLVDLIALVRRRPLILWTGITSGEASVARSSYGLQRLFTLYRRTLFRHAAAIVAYGTATRHYLAELGVSEDKVFSGTQVMPIGQLPPPAADKAALGLAGKTVVLSVNYLIPRKGLDVLIKAFQRVAGPDDVLVLVGSGPEEEALRQLTDGNDRILFPGYQSGVQKTAWYAAADLFVFPTLHDPWGLVVNEAMAFGLPIIATEAAGCVPDLVQDNGLVVPAGNTNALATAVAQLLTDEALRRKMGQRSQHIISAYTVETARDTFLQAINRALEKC
jgi:glycosyltransferase involved in cell wall biosynthesis